MMTVATTAPEVERELSVDADLALAFVEMAASGRAQEAFDRYGAIDFRHHNPHFGADGETLVAAMDEDARTKPGRRLEVLRIIAEEPYVVLHSRMSGGPDGGDLATVHIFRIGDGKIHEMWDVVQEVPPDSPNQSGMF